MTLSYWTRRPRRRTGSRRACCWRTCRWQTWCGPCAACACWVFSGSVFRCHSQRCSPPCAQWVRRKCVLDWRSTCMHRPHLSPVSTRDRVTIIVAGHAARDDWGMDSSGLAGCTRPGNGCMRAIGRGHAQRIAGQHRSMKPCAAHPRTCGPTAAEAFGTVVAWLSKRNGCTGFHVRLLPQNPHVRAVRHDDNALLTTQQFALQAIVSPQTNTSMVLLSADLHDP